MLGREKGGMYEKMEKKIWSKKEMGKWEVIVRKQKTVLVQNKGRWSFKGPKTNWNKYTVPKRQTQTQKMQKISKVWNMKRISNSTEWLAWWIEWRGFEREWVASW